MCGDTPSAPAVSFALFLDEGSVRLGLQLECTFALNSGNFFSKEMKLLLHYLQMYLERPSTSSTDASASLLSLLGRSNFKEEGLNNEMEWFCFTSAQQSLQTTIAEAIIEAICS